MSRECKETKKLVAKIKGEILEHSSSKEKISRYLERLRCSNDIVTEFNENLWQATVESVKVYADKTFSFMCRDGTEILIKPSKTK